MIQSEINGEYIPMMSMMVHAQDILMDAIAIKDMAVEFVELYKRLS
jgi:PTS system cellobiose-specific IIA component